MPSPQSATCSLIPSFQTLVIHACGDLALWMNKIENALAFLSCPSVHMNGVWIRMAAIKLTILRLALAPGISLLICPSSFTFATQISLDPAALCEVKRLSKEDLNANATKNEGRDEVSFRAFRFAFSLCLCGSRSSNEHDDETSGRGRGALTHTHSDAPMSIQRKRSTTTTQPNHDDEKYITDRYDETTRYMSTTRARHNAEKGSFKDKNESCSSKKRHTSGRSKRESSGNNIPKFTKQELQTNRDRPLQERKSWRDQRNESRRPQRMRGRDEEGHNHRDHHTRKHGPKVLEKVVIDVIYKKRDATRPRQSPSNLHTVDVVQCFRHCATTGFTGSLTDFSPLIREVFDEFTRLLTSW